MATQNGNLVRTTRPTQMTLTRLVIPTGAIGRVLNRRNGEMFIDFGLLSVIRLSSDSPPVAAVREEIEAA